MTGDEKNGFFRLFPFVKNSVTYNIVKSTEQAFEASKQFRLFTQLLSALPLQNLKITLPGFHDLSNRYKQFEQALTYGDPLRIRQTKNESNFIKDNVAIVSTYEKN